MPNTSTFRVAAVIGTLALSGCSSDEPTAVAAPPEPAACITGLSSSATCYAGTQLSGAKYQIAIPTNWNGIFLRSA